MDCYILILSLFNPLQLFHIQHLSFLDSATARRMTEENACRMTGETHIVQFKSRKKQAQALDLGEVETVLAWPHRSEATGGCHIRAKRYIERNNDSIDKPCCISKSRSRLKASTWICRTRSRVRPISCPTSSSVAAS